MLLIGPPHFPDAGTHCVLCTYSHHTICCQENRSVIVLRISMCYAGQVMLVTVAASIQSTAVGGGVGLQLSCCAPTAGVSGTVD